MIRKLKRTCVVSLFAAVGLVVVMAAPAVADPIDEWGEITAGEFVVGAFSFDISDPSGESPDCDMPAAADPAELQVRFSNLDDGNSDIEILDINVGPTAFLDDQGMVNTWRRLDLSVTNDFGWSGNTGSTTDGTPGTLSADLQLKAEIREITNAGSSGVDCTFSGSVCQAWVEFGTGSENGLTDDWTWTDWDPIDATATGVNGDTSTNGDAVWGGCPTSISSQLQGGVQAAGVEVVFDGS